MWINTTEKDPEVFARQAEGRCSTYLAAKERHATDGTQTGSDDEMTGLQRRVRKLHTRMLLRFDFARKQIV